jgi:DNA-binding NarL/FixJ family response regulator
MRNEENAAPIRLLIADDHALVRRLRSILLEQKPDFEIVGEAGDER